MDLSFLHYKMESSDQVTDSIVLYCSALHCTALLLCCTVTVLFVLTSARGGQLYEGSDNLLY
jgi:hypothetical protein